MMGSMKQKGLRRVGILVLTLGLLFGGCNGTETPAPESDTIVLVAMSGMRGVNELTAGATPLHTGLFQYAMFLPLLEEQADYLTGPATFEPRLAESYEFSDDRTELTFKLRQDAVWSDGEPVTAEDVRWTWQAQTSPEVAWALASSKDHIRDVEVVDPHTVRFHFDRVYAVQLLHANMGVVLPKHAWSGLPFSEWRNNTEWFVDNLVVNGPFDLESWEPGQRIVLRRNERYFDPGRPRVERMVFRITPDRAGQLALLRSGEAHLIPWARPADAAAFEKEPDIELISYIPRGPNVLAWNTVKPMFAAKETRQALTLAIDRQGIIDSIYHGYANVTDSLFMSNLWACNKELKPWPYDPERAKELLASQGWDDSDGDGVLDRGGERFSFEILSPSGNELRSDILVMVQEQLARVGVDARQRLVEHNSLLARARSHDFEVVFTGLGMGTDLDLTPFFHSSSAEAYNFGSYANPEFDRALDELKDQVDMLAAKPIYDRLQALLHEDMPITVLYEPHRVVPIRKSLRGTSPNALSTYFNLDEWELQPEGG